MDYSEKVNKLLEQGILPDENSLNELDKESEKELKQNQENNNQEEQVVKKNSTEYSQELKEVFKDDDQVRVKIVYNYDKPSKKRVIQDFVKYFNHRYKGLEKIIKQRPEMQSLMSINKLNLKSEKEKVSIIGIITEKRETKNNHIMLKVEDQTGVTNVLISKNNTELYPTAKDLILDEVIGISGSVGKNIIFANEIIFPDIPLNRELKKGPRDVYAIFIGDLHFGSKEFLKDEFEKFIKWINGELGSKEQREIANKTKYLFVMGDLVEGVGVYPNQDEDLVIPDIKLQYKLMAVYFEKIKKDKKIIIIPGNHDAGRIADPQPALYNDFCQALEILDNAIILSSPSMVNIESTEDFSGLDILLYHGYSLIYYADNVASIRAAGGQKRVDLLMKFLLQKRHLAPTHEANMYVPDADEDPLIITHVPDIFVTGHIHRAMAEQYRSVTIMNTSCWGDITENQEKRGLEPQPGRVLALNLQTRKVKIVNFYTRKEKKKSDENSKDSDKMNEEKKQTK